MSRASSGRWASRRASANPGAKCGRGLVESTQWALLIPVLLFGIFGIIQGSIYLAGRAAVQQAAMAGAEHAAFAGSAAGAGGQVAADLANRAGLSGVSVQVNESATGVEVWVQGRVDTVLPGDWSLVEASAYRAKEG